MSVRAEPLRPGTTPPARPAVFVDHALAARIEAVEAVEIEGLARKVAERLPGSCAAFATIAGGRAGFLAPGLNVSRAAGLGMSGPVSAADVEALEDFYRSRGTDARVLVSPFADESLFEHLGARGFQLVELATVLVRRIDLADRAPSPGLRPPHAVVVRRAALADASAWVHASLSGFAPPGEGPALDRAPIFEAAFEDPDIAYFTGTVAGVVAGAAALHVHGPTAYFFAASTLAAFRGRGVQGALIAARLALAAEAGCDLGYTVTAAGGASQRNFERAGFAPAYSQALLVKRFG
jgi:ribosomal protein S18 acetylase RimI-like enzyme